MLYGQISDAWWRFLRRIFPRCIFSLFQHIYPVLLLAPFFFLLCFLVLHHSLQACLNPHIPLFSGGVIVSIHWRNHYSLLAVSITKDSQKDMMFVFHHTFFRCQVVFLQKREEFGLKMTSFFIFFLFFALLNSVAQETANYSRTLPCYSLPLRSRSSPCLNLMLVHYGLCGFLWPHSSIMFALKSFVILYSVWVNNIFSSFFLCLLQSLLL